MGLGKIARGGGKVAATVQVGLLLFDLGASIFNRLRGRSKDQTPDLPPAIDEAYADRGERQSAEQDHLQP
ncbi:hypothetical protein [Sphingobium sp.]|uniref:hypothetical protein n=1 Tax=Sphingobium sp. TaxID=1912891 RepID=UPI003BB54793